MNVDPLEGSGLILPRAEITVLPADESKKLIGWTITETIGVGAYNAYALDKLWPNDEGELPIWSREEWTPE